MLTLKPLSLDSIIGITRKTSGPVMNAVKGHRSKVTPVTSVYLLNDKKIICEKTATVS